MREVGYNKKAYFDYEILENFEAGIVLNGSEVKSMRSNKVNMADAYISVKHDNQAYLYNLHVPEYKMSILKKQEPKRVRKLLLHRKQIDRLSGFLNRGGYTLIPLSIYFNESGFVKVKFGLARGKKLVDKRETIKEREWNREKSRILKKQI